MLDCFTKNKRAIKIGIAPTRRTTWTHKPFNLPEAIRYKEMIVSKLREFDVELVTLDGITEDGMLFQIPDTDKVSEVFINAGVDGVFVPHCNFGSEESVAKVCKRVGKPVLLWGPKDYINPDDFYRYRDSQCGLFATSKVLSTYGVPFTYIENCDVEDPIFTEGFEQFIRVCSVVKAFRNLRIGQIGTRPSTFASVKCNEMELLEKFGIEILPITMADLRRMLDSFESEKADLLDEHVKQMKETFDVGLLGQHWY